MQKTMSTYAKTRYAIVLALVVVLSSCSNDLSLIIGDKYTHCTLWIPVHYDEPNGKQRASSHIRTCYIPKMNKVMIVFDDYITMYLFADEIRLGASVYAQYLETKEQKYLLIWYGYDSEDKDGNFFDYILYTLLPPKKLSEGVAVRPISVSEILKNNGGVPSPN